MIFQELSSIPNELIPVFQKEPSSGWPEYNTQSTFKPQSGVKQLDRLVQTTTHVTPSTIFISAIKTSAVQTQSTSENSSTTVTSSKRRTKTADTIAKKQPRKQFIRETFSPSIHFGKALFAVTFDLMSTPILTSVYQAATNSENNNTDESRERTMQVPKSENTTKVTQRPPYGNNKMRTLTHENKSVYPNLNDENNRDENRNDHNVPTSPV